MALRAAVILAVMLVAGCGDPNWSDSAVTQSKANGDQIVAAMQKYRTAQGRFPASLDQLVPKYLPAISPPTAGKKQWEYAVSPSGGFCNLTFKQDASPAAESHNWCSDGSGWTYDDAKF